MSYTTLQSQIIDYSHRTDFTSTQIQDFIKLAEAAMYDNDMQPLLVREMEFTSTTSATGRTITLPDYFERARAVAITIGSEKVDLKFQTPEQMKKRSGTGTPCFFSVISNEIELDITPSNEYTLELQYYRKAPPLSDDTPTNTILENHYRVYLFGALSELFSHVLDTEQEQRYTSKFYSAIKGANKADKKGRYGSAPVMTVEGVVP
jgi:hypothetical protein